MSPNPCPRPWLPFPSCLNRRAFSLSSPPHITSPRLTYFFIDKLRPTVSTTSYESSFFPGGHDITQSLLSFLADTFIRSLALLLQLSQNPYVGFRIEVPRSTASETVSAYIPLNKSRYPRHHLHSCSAATETVKGTRIPIGESRSRLRRSQQTDFFDLARSFTTALNIIPISSVQHFHWTLLIPAGR
jgi:hypothetical protein